MVPIRRAGFVLVVLAFLVPPASAQHDDMSIPAGGPFSRDAVLNAPFAADATTHIIMRLPDGRAGEYTVTARYYRDSQGRVRAEMDTPEGPYGVLEIPPGKYTRDHVPFYVFDVARRTYRPGPGIFRVARLFNGETRVAIPAKQQNPAWARFCFQIAPPVTADASDEERLKAVDAQMAPDLGIVIASHRADVIGSVDYRMTNIRRGEPSADLFDVLTTYSFVNEPLATAPWQSPPACGPIKK